MNALVESGPALLFYLFAAIAVVGAVGVVTLRNPMYGALSLLATFLSVAALFLLRHAEFVAIVQIFVYGGGIMVLFLFVIMLVNLQRLRESRLFNGPLPAVLVLAVLLLGLFGWVFVHAPFGPAFDQPELFTSYIDQQNTLHQGAGNTEAVAWALYTKNLLPFEVASLFLLVAMIGAVVLGRRQ
ncbi:MAG TPA: NADH-quinone oxidoreductase subunit J [Acidobacteria bacterium]|nr:NADH-quinone oxidoreductase subunit J [Acidobacteriota bacterium]